MAVDTELPGLGGTQEESQCLKDSDGELQRRVGVSLVLSLSGERAEGWGEADLDMFLILECN